MKMMRPATRVAAVCIGIIAVAAAICFGIIGYFRLEKAVLIPRQTEFALYPSEEEDVEDSEADPYDYVMQFYFLTNGGDLRRLSEVNFAETDQIRLFPVVTESLLDSEEEPEYMAEDPNSRIGFYRGEWIALVFDSDTMEYLNNMTDSVTVKTATLHYEDGSAETIDIDPITFHRPGGNNVYREDDPPGTFSQVTGYLKERGLL